MKIKNRKLKRPSLYFDRQDKIYYFIIAQNIVYDQKRFLMAQSVSFDEKNKKVKTERRITMIEQELFNLILGDGSYRFQEVTEKKQSQWPVWKKIFYEIPGVFYDIDNLAQQIAKLDRNVLIFFIYSLATALNNLQTRQ